MSTARKLKPCCEHAVDQHWPEGNCRVCLDCSCDWFGARWGNPRRTCRCKLCQPDLDAEIMAARGQR